VAGLLFCRRCLKCLGVLGLRRAKALSAGHNRQQGTAAAPEHTGVKVQVNRRAERLGETQTVHREAALVLQPVAPRQQCHSAGTRQLTPMHMHLLVGCVDAACALVGSNRVPGTQDEDC
jgi:hypothetical protein